MSRGSIIRGSTIDLILGAYSIFPGIAFASLCRGASGGSVGSQ